MFSEWVIDSIAIVKYLKDDKYFIDPPAGAAGADEEKGKGKKKKGKNKDKGEEVAATTPTFVDSAATPSTDTIPTALGSDIATTTTPAVTDTSAAKLTDTSKMASAVDTSGPVKRRINWSKVKHKNIFESNDDEIKAKIAPMYDPVTGKIREELYVYNFTYLRATGTNKNVKVGEYVTEQINIYPDTKIWFKDLVNSQVEILVENYFTQPPFDDYPVVGVTWKQARAFAAWRSHTNFDYATIAEYLKYYRLQFSLPSEAQWVYAAGKDIKDSKQPVMDKEPEPEATPEPAVVTDSATLAATTVNADGSTTPVTDSTATITPAIDTTAVAITDTEDGNDKKSKKDKKKKKKKNRKNSDDEEADEEPNPDTVIAVNDKDAIPLDRDRDGNLLVNFKQEEGDYTEDGSNFTLPVMSYAPNEFGVYNMVGNVAEWVLDAYSPSAFAFVSDINPVLLYDADSTEADPMKRKVVRGGSFVSNAKALSPFTRDFELQDQVHCYIGFRCVMSAPEILTKYVATRRVQTGSKKPNMTSMEKAKPTSSTNTKAKPAETKPATNAKK